MKRIYALSSALLFLGLGSALGCTNFIVTRGASADGSVMVTYAADSHALYGCLYQYLPSKSKVKDVVEWDTGRYIGQIPEAEESFSTVGNMSSRSVIVGETTWGGRPELEDRTGKMDYGSMIYISLQRAKTAREAIRIMVDLAQTYGYCSEGESFSVADADEAWILELVGKGTKLDAQGNNLRKGCVYVARRIPDGMISAHANQARITTFPKNDPDNCIYSEDVISFAREMGYFDGKDEDFSFSDTYNPLDFGGMRACEARVWSFFRRFSAGMDAYTDYAMGHNPKNRMPLWVRPTSKISAKQLFDAMRDHYEGTVLDMTKDVGAGGSHCPYRWRPMSFKVDGKEYCHERATATQQTGFWFCAQARQGKTGILWFGVDDTATSCLTPIYCSSTEIPWSLSEKNGSLLKYSDTSMFWLFNRISNFAYLRYDLIQPRVKEEIDRWENERLKEVAETDGRAEAMGEKKARKYLTSYSVSTAQKMFSRFSELEKYLFVKFMDGNVKGEDGKGFVDNGNGKDIPGKIEHPAYSESFLRNIVRDNGEVLRAK